MALALVGGGCATSSGWSLAQTERCQADSAPRVCVLEDPDYGHVLGVGDVDIIPGECALGPDEGKGGRLGVVVRDREGGEQSTKVGVRRGGRTYVSVDEAGRLDTSRDRCE